MRGSIVQGIQEVALCDGSMSLCHCVSRFRFLLVVMTAAAVLCCVVMVLIVVSWCYCGAVVFECCYCLFVVWECLGLSLWCDGVVVLMVFFVGGSL